MLFGRKSSRARVRRSSFASDYFDCSNRLEARSLTVPLFTDLAGFLYAQAGANTRILPTGPTITNDSIGSTQTINIPTGQGSGSTTNVASADTIAEIVTGPNGASSVDLSGLLTGSINAQVQTGILFGAGAGASVQSDNGSGTQAPLALTIADNNPKEAVAPLTVTFQINGTDGINSTTSTNMLGQFNFDLDVGPYFIVDLNAGGFNGLNVFVSPTGNPMTQYVAYSHGTGSNPATNNPDGSIDGDIRYAPGAPDAIGGFSFGTKVQATIQVPTATILPIDYRAAFNEVANPAVAAGQQVHAMPNLQWTLSISNG